jgi:ABC-type molybdenum transport system ATPase subunit/photorepair protein PhrA
MSGMWIAATVALALWAFWLSSTLRNDLRESEQIRDALVSAVHDCRAEIARLRLTDAEREAVEWCVEMAVVHATECDEEIATLRGLLERTK